MNAYYLEGYVRILAASNEEAEAKFEAAGLGGFVEDPNVDGVMLDFQGEWDEIEEIPEPDCICPPEMVARNDGSFRGGCPKHG